jgi:phage shock protein PspC (stress-responsive transcriptional regulator)
MNEITRIHIAKVAYEIEVNAKKQLEKYIKSLENYTQDQEVFTDIEIRMTELLAERGVKAGGVIGSDDIAAIRKQLGEPYEFADDDGDIAVGATGTGDENHRLYRSVDDAILGGVLSGVAAYFKVNPLWTRLIFILVTFVSFGLALVLYAALWIIVPAARTAAQKLQLAGKPVTLESIRELNIQAEANQSPAIAPVVRRGLGIAAGVTSILAAVTTLATTVAGVLAILGNGGVSHVANNVFGIGGFGIGNQYTEHAWVVFWIVLAGMLLLTALFSLVAYAFLAKKFTKRMLISAVIITSLGLISVTAAAGITATQSWRISSEAQAQVQTTKLNLPKEIEGIQSIVFEDQSDKKEDYYAGISSVQYIVDEGTPRYELAALPKAKVSVKIEGQTARVSLDIPSDYRNAFVRTSLIIYGPALPSITTDGVRVNYSNVSAQESLNLTLNKNHTDVSVEGTFQSVVVTGKGSVDLSSSAIQLLDVRSEQQLTVNGGTIRELTVTQPEVCASSTYRDSTNVSLSGVTSGFMTYNGNRIAAETYRTNCASVVIEDTSERQ